MALCFVATGRKTSSMHKCQQPQTLLCACTIPPAQKNHRDSVPSQLAQYAHSAARTVQSWVPSLATAAASLALSWGVHLDCSSAGLWQRWYRARHAAAVRPAPNCRAIASHCTQHMRPFPSESSHQIARAQRHQSAAQDLCNAAVSPAESLKPLLPSHTRIAGNTCQHQ